MNRLIHGELTLLIFLLYAATDFCGEKLAWLLGITSPKYQYAIDEFHRLKQEVRLGNRFKDPFTIHLGPSQKCGNI